MLAEICVLTSSEMTGRPEDDLAIQYASLCKFKMKIFLDLGLEIQCAPLGNGWQHITRVLAKPFQWCSAIHQMFKTSLLSCFCLKTLLPAQF